MPQDKDITDLIENTIYIHGRGLILLLKKPHSNGTFEINQIIIYNDKEYIIRGIEGFRYFQCLTQRALLVKEIDTSSKNVIE